jgi:Ser/Thr protein kinase RdoA (MazF antagonist)
VIARANVLFAKLYADEDNQILIHGDLHYWNVHVHRGELTVIDFEDVMRGYPVQDIAITLSYGNQREDYPDLRAAFERGYTSVRAWPAESERQIQTLIAARNVMFINYVARIDAAPQDYVETRCKRLERFLTTYA